MASTNKTTNYELSQFIETDRPAWLTDYNSDMRKIDSNLKEVSDIAGGASGSISALADRMSAAEGNITTNANDIDALEARADSLEAQAQSTAGTIANIQTEQTAQNLGIEAATELGYNLARPYDSASTYAVGAYVLFQNTLYKCVTAIATGEAFDPTKWLAIKAMDEVGGGSSTYELIEFNANNQPFTLTNVILSTKNPYTYGTYINSNPTNASLSNFSGFYFKQGRLRHLDFNGSIRFDQLTFTGDTLYNLAVTLGLNTNLIDLPKDRSTSFVFLNSTNTSDIIFGSFADFQPSPVVLHSFGILYAGSQSASRTLDAMYLRGSSTYIA